MDDCACRTWTIACNEGDSSALRRATDRGSPGVHRRNEPIIICARFAESFGRPPISLLRSARLRRHRNCWLLPLCEWGRLRHEWGFQGAQEFLASVPRNLWVDPSTFRAEARVRQKSTNDTSTPQCGITPTRGSLARCRFEDFLHSFDHNQR
jgi:hypothetical protein